MKLINFSHPLTDANRQQLGFMVCTPSDPFTKEDIINVRVSIKTIEEVSFQEQIEAIVDAAGLTAEQWQNEDIIVNLPGLKDAAAGIIAALHGRIGHFPDILFLEKATGPITSFNVVGVESLQTIHETAKRRSF